MSNQNELRIKEVILCDTGCGRVARESGFCEPCESGIIPTCIAVDAMGATRLEGLWNFQAHRRPTRPEVAQVYQKPYMPDWMYWLLTAGTIALCGGIFFKIAEMFADWLANGGSPWQ